MTDKKANILTAALELFAQEGYKSTTTAKVAKRAGVSEGLIFRHFENKEGLLKAIMDDGERQAASLFTAIISETWPKEIIKKTINLAIEMSSSTDKAAFWKLQYKLKWELGFKNLEKTAPLHRVLTFAFTAMQYPSPNEEATFLLIYLDGLASRLFLVDNFDVNPQISFLYKKYHLD